jgi:flagellin
MSNMNSVNTNVGAMVALQNLNATNSELSIVQSRINTGRKINSAKDNGAIWAIAQGQRSESNALNAVKESLQRGQSTIDVAMAAGESISDLLIQMKEKALAATDSTLDTDSRTALANDFTSLRDQIKKIAANAEFNGTNMIKTSGTAVAALANAKDGATRSTITVAAQPMHLGSTGVTVTNAETFSSVATASAVLIKVNASIKNVSTALTKLGTGSKALATHLSFMTKLQDTLDAGVGNLVDADLAKESARLQALQTKQQLGIQALAIANGSSSTLLGLFR